MNDLDQYEINALRADNLIDACEQSGHPYPTFTVDYDDGAKAIVCSNCERAVDFISAETAEA